MHHIETMCHEQGRQLLHFLFFELSSLDLVPYSKLCPGLNNNFMVYLLQLHINPFSEWHLAGASMSYGHFF